MKKVKNFFKNLFRLIPKLMFWRGFSRRNKVGTAVGFIILALVSFLYIRAAIHPGKSEAAWFNTDWAFRQSVNITNNGSAQTSYLITVTVDTQTLIAAGKMKSD